MRIGALCSGLFVVLLLALASAAVGDQTGRCQEVRGHAVLKATQFPCLTENVVDDTVFDGCYISMVKGNLKGPWISFVQDDWGFDLATVGAPVPDGSPATWYNREFEVFETKHGVVYGDAQFAFDFRIFDSDGGGAIPTIITGGSGIYEDAMGWIVATFKDGSIETFHIRGRICGPNIPGYSDDDDD